MPDLSSWKKFKESNYFQETTIHGLSYISKVKNMKKGLFWIFLSCLAFMCATNEVTTEMRQLFRDEMSIRIRPARKEELMFPTLKFCYHTWQALAKCNWNNSNELTKNDMLLLMSLARVYKFPNIERFNFTSTVDSLHERFGSNFDLMEIINQSLINFWPKGSTLFFDDDSDLCFEFGKETLLDVDPENTSVGSLLKQIPFCIENSNHTGSAPGTISKSYGDFYINNEIVLSISKKYIGRTIYLKIDPEAIMKYKHSAQTCVDRTTVSQEKRFELLSKKLCIVTGRHNRMTIEGSCDEQNARHPLFGLKFVDWSYQRREERAQENQPPPCLQWTFMHTGMLNGRKFSSNNPSDCENFVCINLQFPSTDTWFVTEYVQSITFSEITSNIGGTLGIWMGASILSFVHIAVFVCEKFCESFGFFIRQCFCKQWSTSKSLMTV